MGEMGDRVGGKAKQVEGVLTGNKWRQLDGFLDEVKGNIKGVAHRIGDHLRSLAGRARRILARGRT
jgi:uncharacterized protein YjbJ (UPF0337 family)